LTPQNFYFLYQLAPQADKEVKTFEGQKKEEIFAFKLNLAVLSLMSVV